MLRRFVTAVLAVALVVPATTAHADPVTTTWTPERNLSLPGAAAFDADIASSADGNSLVATWGRTDGVLDRIQVTRSSDGGQTWATPLNISGNDAGEARVAMTPAGNKVVAVWLRRDGAVFRVEAATSNDGGATWSTPSFISVGGQQARDARVEVSSDGQRAMALWKRNDGTHYRIQAAFSTDAGLTWSAPETLSSAGSNAASGTFVLSEDGRKATATWQDLVGVRSARTIDGGITWSSPMSVSADVAMPAALAGSTTGDRVFAIWTTPVVGGPYITTAVSTDAGATWSTPVNRTATDDLTRDPRIDASSDGQRLTAVWRQARIGTEHRIYWAASSDGGTTWTPAIPLSPVDRDAGSPLVTASADGRRVTVLWQRSDGARIRVQSVSSADHGQTWSSPQTLSGAGQDARLSAAASSANGRRVAAIWDRYDGSFQRVQAANGTVASSPGAPGRPSATPGDTTATISWPTADDGGSPITGYTATAGSQTCTTATTTCTLSGLINGTTYSVTVTATNAVGTGPASAATSVTPVGPAPPPALRTSALVKARAGKSKLLVVVKPNLGAKQQWSFQVQRKRGKQWRNLGKVRTTTGAKHRRVLDLPKGTYRVLVSPAYGYEGSTSKAVRLRR